MPDGPGNATVNFVDVNSAGTTTVDALTGGPELPAGYTLGGARFYDVGTTADFGEPVTLCLDYDPARYHDDRGPPAAGRRQRRGSTSR